MNLKEIIIEAIEDNDFLMIEIAAQKGADLNFTNRNGETPLYISIIKNKPEMVKALVKHGADVNYAKSGLMSPLMLSITHNVEIAKLLIENGADVDTKCDLNRTPLHRACNWNYFEGIELLLSKGANINARDTKGSTPLHMLCDDEESPKGIKSLDLMISKGANINAQTSFGVTPIQMALTSGNYEYAKRLIAAGANPTLEDNRGATAFHSISEGPGGKGSVEILAEMIKISDEFAKPECSGKTPFDLAIGSANVTIAWEYLKLMPNDKAGKSALLEIIGEDWQRIKELVDPSEEIIARAMVASGGQAANFI